MKQNQAKRQKAAKTPVVIPESQNGEDGVDLSLIQWMLSLTPTKRLQVLQNTIRSIMKLRGD